jgi:hypothetical protein
MENKINIIEKKIQNLLKQVLDLQNEMRSLKKNYNSYSDDIYCESIPSESFYNVGKLLSNGESVYYISSDSESES